MWVGPDGITYQNEAQGRAYMANFGGGGVFGSGGGVQPVGVPGGTAGPTAPGAGGGFNWQATKDPGMSNILQMMKKRYGDQYSMDPDLKARMSVDTTNRAISRATNKIGDAALGQMSRAATMRARGIADGPSSRSVGEDAARRKAGASADISLGRERDLDAMATTSSGQRSTWEQGRNALLGLAGGMATGIAGNQLAQTQTGGNIWNMGNQSQLDAFRTYMPWGGGVVGPSPGSSSPIGAFSSPYRSPTTGGTHSIVGPSGGVKGAPSKGVGASWLPVAPPSYQPNMYNQGYQPASMYKNARYV